MDTQLDPTVVNLAKAIRQTESGGDFNAKGKSGEHGAYQFTPDTWNAEASKYGINVPIEQATPEQQNAVAYNRIKKWKDAGYDVTQIASMWNAGEAEPNAYTGKFGSTTATHQAGDASVGVNKFGAHYSVPDYVKSVANAYLTLKGGGDVGMDPNNPSSIANPTPLEPQAPEVPEAAPIVGGQGLGLNLGSPGVGAVDLTKPIVGIGQNIASDVKQNVSEAADALTASREGRMNPFQAGAQIAKNVSSALVSPITETVGKLMGKVTSPALDPIIKQINDSPTVTAFTDFLSKYPRVADVLSNLVETGTNMATLEGTRQAVGKLSEVSVAKAQQASEADVNTVSENIAPKVTAAEAKLAMKQGRIVGAEEPGLFTSGKPGEVEPAEAVKRAAKTVVDEVPGAAKMDRPTLFNALDDAIGKTAKELRPEMEKIEVKPESFDALKSNLEELQTKQLYEADADQEVNVKKIQQKFTSRIEGLAERNPNLSDIWDERVDYDNSVPDRIKKANINSPANYQYQRTIWLQNRALLNAMIHDAESGLGEASRAAFAKMSDMYTAQNGLLTNAKEVLKAKPSKIVDWIRRNPKKATVGSLIIGSQLPGVKNVAKTVVSGL